MRTRSIIGANSTLSSMHIVDCFGDSVKDEVGAERPRLAFCRNCGLSFPWCGLLSVRLPEGGVLSMVEAPANTEVPCTASAVKVLPPSKVLQHDELKRAAAGKIGI
jgi:hypothetical protein